MRELQVIFHSPREIAQFVQIAACQPGEIDVTLDERTVNGKDMLGMFTMELSRALLISFSGEETDFRNFEDNIRTFLA